MAHQAVHQHRSISILLLSALSAVILLGACAASASDDAATVEQPGPRVAILITEGFHDGETLVPLGYLVNRGYQVTVIGLEPGTVKAYNSDITMHVAVGVADVSAEEFDALILPGGQAPAVLRENDDVLAFVRAFADADKVMAAICHGPQVLVRAGVLEGRNVTGVEGIRDELAEAGANYSDVPVMRDGNLVTSRVPGDLPAFMQTIEELLDGVRS